MESLIQQQHINYQIKKELIGPHAAASKVAEPLSGL